MEGSSLCSLTRKMECPGLLSKGDPYPFHCHCLAHFQSYRLHMVGGPGQGPVVAELDSGWDNRWATTSSNAWSTSFNSSSNARNSAKMSTFRDLQKKRGKTTKLLSFFLLMLILYISCIFFCFGLHVGSQIQFCRRLN